MSQIALNDIATSRPTPTKTPAHIFSPKPLAKLTNLVKSLFRSKKREPYIVDSLVGIVRDTGQTLDSIKTERLFEKHGVLGTGA